MTESDLKAYQAMLGTKLAQVGSSLRRHEDITVERVPEAIDEGQLSAERDFTIRTLERDTALFREVRAALERIEDGSYGLCLNCGVEIRRARLSAVPWTAYCIGCQEAMELESGYPAGGDVPMLDEAA
jgi:DnaK suppressor protein